MSSPALNLDARLTAADAARFFRVSREVVYQWVARYEIEVRDRMGPRRAPRYRFGDLVAANTRALLNTQNLGRRAS